MHTYSLLPLSLLLTLLDVLCPVHAIRIPVEVRSTFSPQRSLPGHIGRRAVTTIPVSNTHNAQYITNITIAGQQVRVMIDTGSSDLWVNFPTTTPQTEDLGKGVTLNYAVGAASGV